MKKILLIAFGLLFLIPSTNAFAAEGGLLNNKPFKDNAGLEYYQATDNDPSTSIRFGWYQMNIVTYTFEQPTEIESYIAYSGLNSAVYYYDSNNVLLHSTTGTANRTNVRTHFSTALQGVKKITLRPTGGNSTDWFEFDVFNAQDVTPPGEIKNLTYEVTETSAAFTFDLPTETDFSHLKILKDGVLVEGNFKGSSYTALGLTDNTPYTFKFIAVDNLGNTSNGITQNVTTKKILLAAGEILNLTAEAAAYNRVNLSWTLPGNENLKHVNIYRDTVIETSLLDTLLGTSRAYAAETKIFETNGTYFNDLTVNEQTTYEYTLTTTSTDGIESEGITEEVTTPEKPAPEIVGGGYEKDPTTGDFIYYWTSPTEGQVKILVGGSYYKTAAAADQQIVIPVNEMKYTAFGDPNVSLIPIDSDGEEGVAIRPPLNGEGSPDGVGNVDIPFSVNDLLNSGMGLFILLAPFVILALSFLLVPKLRRILFQTFARKEVREERKRRFETEAREKRTREERETKGQRETREREERLTFTEKKIGRDSAKETVIVKAQRAPKERKGRKERSTRTKRERVKRERIPRSERGLN